MKDRLLIAEAMLLQAFNWLIHGAFLASKRWEQAWTKRVCRSLHLPPPQSRAVRLERNP